ncbi:unnamed protein product, partial [Ectocarpus sp. 4 AP-2014]
ALLRSRCLLCTSLPCPAYSLLCRVCARRHSLRANGSSLRAALPRCKARFETVRETKDQDFDTGTNVRSIMMAYEDQPAFFPAATDTNKKVSLGDGRGRSDPALPSFSSKLPVAASFRREEGTTAVAHHGSPRFDDSG